MGSGQRMSMSILIAVPLLSILLHLIQPIECHNTLPALYITTEKSLKSGSTEIVKEFFAPRSQLPNGTHHYANITFVALLPSRESDNENDCIMPKVLAVLELGIRNVQQLGFAHNTIIDITLIARDSFCSSIYGPIGFFEIYTNYRQIHAVFGLPCDYVLAPISRYAGVWQIPVLTSGGNANDFSKKAESYSTLTRLKGAQMNNLGQGVLAIIDDFNWTTTALIYQNENSKLKGNSVCFFCMVIVHDKLKKLSVFQQAFDTNLWTKPDIKNMLKKISMQTRVVIMCADPQSIRQIMLTAEELNMIDSGEYVFINIELFSRVPHVTSQPWYDKNDMANNERAKKAYTAMLTVTPKQPNDDEYTRISNKIKKIAADKYNYTFHENEPISDFVTSFYDGVLLYAHALNDSIRENPKILNEPINGTDMVRRMWNTSFLGITGNVTIDSNGDRISAYSLLDMNPKTGHFEIVANFLHNKLEYVPGKVIHWAGDRTDPPLDKPKCGFDGSLCPDNSLPGYAILSMILGFVVVVMIVCFIFGYRHYKSEAEINSMSWRVSVDDLIYHDDTGRGLRGSYYSLVRHSSQQTLVSEDMGSFAGDRQIFIPVGVYKGCKVAIKAIDPSINASHLPRSLMLELKRMKDLQHDHLVKFYGACLSPKRSFLLTEYCPKGSLQDILENEQFQLDWMFKLSLMHDIVRGMAFLHSSDLKSHGNLKSSNCVVDSRFVLKITDFGLHSLRKKRPNLDMDESDVENCNSHAYWSKLFWTAPELLKLEQSRPPEGTQKGDVYSFGIIVHEITTRQGPFFLGHDEPDKSPQEIIELIKGYPHLVPQPFRPQVNCSDNYNDVYHIMAKCWSEDPMDRPDFNSMKNIIRKINKDNETGNIVDNLLKRMEQYANNLEELVEERTQDYIEEKKKCEKLLYQLLPQSVAAQLISGQPVIAETFDQVTIYFSDIVGFTAISAQSTPLQVVQFLNDLYTCFDSIAENFDVYKVETIGDAYMVVSGLPIRNGKDHAREIARMSLALLDAVHNFKIHHRPNDRLSLRIGLHTGACVAGVVGLKMPRYCLFGDTVNTANRMESNGEALKIHISESTKNALDEFGSFITTRRGYVPVKGKGEMLTYWLEGEMQKPTSPASSNKLMLSRRSSLKHAQMRCGNSILQKQQSEQFAALMPPPPYRENSLNSNSRQNSPNLRVKRKISSSSPKLNGNGEFKPEDFSYYLESLKPPPPPAMLSEVYQEKTRIPANDIYSSHSLREPAAAATKDWAELSSFRLPLSGALKNHYNSHRNSYSQLLSSANSSSNLSGVLQPSAIVRSRLKPSSTISTLVTSASRLGLEDTALSVIANPNKLVELDEADSGDSMLDADSALLQNAADEEETEEENDNDKDDGEQICIKFNNHLRHSTKSSSCVPTLSSNSFSNSVNSTSNNCNNTNYNNIVKANNVKNYPLLCKNSSSSNNGIGSIEHADECHLMASSSHEDGGSSASSNVRGKPGNAVTQPLLAKINS